MNKHHIYNFHIGFWGAFFISAALIFHSAVLLLNSTAITLAQTAPVTITQPTEGQVISAGQTVQIKATSASAVFNMRADIVQTGTTNSVLSQDMANPSGDFVTWEYNWDTQLQGNFDLVVTGDGQPSSIRKFTVGAPSVDVVLTKPFNSQTLTGSVQLEATTSIAVDSLKFLFDAGGATQVIPFNATGDAAKKFWTHTLDSTLLADSDYQIVAEASLNSNLTQSAPPTNITVSNPVAGSISMVSPSNGAILSGPTTLTATTSTTATSVIFQFTDSGGTVFTTGQANQPTANSWNVVGYDTTQLANGTYSLIAIATFPGVSTPQPSQNLAVTVNNQVAASPLAISTTALAQATAGTNYSQNLNATGGTAPYTWSIFKGVLPSGFVLDQSGSISGSTNQIGSFNIDFKVTDAGASTNVKTFTLTVVANPTTGPVCGDGTVDTTEQCDDGNTTSGDGCSSICQFETAAPTCGDGTVDTTQGEQCDDGNTTSGDGCSAVCAIEQTTTNPNNPTQPNTNQGPATISISEPINNAVIKGDRVLVVVKASEKINQPQMLLVDTSGSNRLINSSTKAFLPVNNAGESIWHYLLDTTAVPDGSYGIGAVTTTADDGETLSATRIGVKIDNPDEGEETASTISGEITSPKESQTQSGQVLLQAKLSGTIQTVTFKLATLASGTKFVTAKFNASKNLWEATWNSSSIAPGPVILTVQANGANTSVKKRTFEILSLTGGVQEETEGSAELSDTIEPRIEEVVDPIILEQVQPDGTLPNVPVECQVARIIDPQECTTYLETRRIRLLNEAEQEQVQEQVNEVVSNHVEFSTSGAIPEDLTRDTRGKKIEAPLDEILPIRREEEKERFYVAPSTKPSASLARFTEQTVNALLIPDKDGDGLSDDAELRYGSDPMNPDTDGDGFLDGVEVKNGFDPAGPGPLVRQTAPVDLAILNKRPLDQPRFAGVIDNERLKVEEVSAIEGDENKFIVRGKADPNSWVTLYVYSSLPVVVSAQANAAGEWEYEFAHPLVDGKHDVYATVTNESGKIEKKSLASTFFVQEAKAVTEEAFLSTTISVQDQSSTFLAYYLIGGLLIIALAGLMVFAYIRKQKSFG